MPLREDFLVVRKQK